MGYDEHGQGRGYSPRSASPIDRAIALLRNAVPDVDYVEADDERHRCLSCDTSARQVAEVIEILRGLL